MPISQVEALADSVLQSVLGLVALLHGLTSGSGPSLKEALKKAAAAVVAPSQQLIVNMFKPDAAAVKNTVGEGPSFT